MLLFLSADFFIFKINFSKTSFRNSNKVSKGLNLGTTGCKGYQQMTRVAASKDIFMNICFLQGALDMSINYIDGKK